MPIIRSQIEGVAPTEPHLAVVRNQSGQVLALPVGSQMFIITDPTHLEGVIPVILVKVQTKYITFRCNCGQAECTRVLQYRVKAMGHHPQSKK